MYIEEAHPDDEWQVQSNRKDNYVYKQPQTTEGRRTLARLLPHRLQYRLPVALDPIDDPAGKAYAAWPERIYVIEKGGRIAYKGEPGPFGFKPELAEAILKSLVEPRLQGPTSR